MYKVLLEEIEKYARENWIPVILGAGAKILFELVQREKPLRILEIGTAIGYSGLLMLSAAPENARLTTIEIDEIRYEKAKENFNKGGVSERVTQILGDCTEFVRFADNKYDFIMLDGPKGQYEEMLFYIDRLLENGGTIFADNILFKGKAIGEEYPKHKHRTIVNVLRRFNKDILERVDYESKLLEDGDGIIIAKKLLQSKIIDKT